MRLVLAILFGLVLAPEASASCVCRCVGGEMQPLCDSSIDIPPLCPAATCALPPPSIAPVAPLRLPPLGASHCSQQQVLNPHTSRYEWHRLCE